MTPIELFAFGILPISLAPGGWAIILISEAINSRRKKPIVSIWFRP